MRPTGQQLNAQSPSDVDKTGTYLEALRECHNALMESNDILEEVAKTVLAYLNDEDVDKEVLRDVCAKAVVLVNSTREQFALGEK